MNETQRKRIARNGIKLYTANGSTRVSMPGIRGGGMSLTCDCDVATAADRICRALDSLQGQRITRRQKADAVKSAIETIA